MRYVSEKVISFSIKPKGEGKSVRVNFGACSNGGSTFITDNQNLIAAMEKSPMFGCIYQRAPECAKLARKAATKKEEVKKSVEPVPGISGWQEAVEYLSTNHGSDVSKLVTPDAILAEAEAKGVKFPDLKV